MARYIYVVYLIYNKTIAPEHWHRVICTDQLKRIWPINLHFTSGEFNFNVELVSS